ncbi:MAG: TIGR00266 family protein, partial [Nitrososphaeraceae archaeon]
MQYRILKEPMAMLEIQLNNDEQLTAEAGAMVYIKGNVEVKTTTRSGGGFFKKFKVAALGRQSFFVNNYVAHEDNCFIGLTGAPIGDVVRMSINAENGLIVQSGAYIASSTGVMLDTEWQGFKKGIFGSGLFMLKANGVGDLFVNAYGGIIQKDLGDNEKMILDNHHLVALSENSNYRVMKFGGLKTTILGGEGL